MMVQKLNKTLREGQHEVVIMDACNNERSDMELIVDSCERFNASLLVCEMEEWNEAACFHNGTHDRTLQDIFRMKRDWYDTPSHMNALDWSFRTSNATQMKLTQKDLERQGPASPVNSRQPVVRSVGHEPRFAHTIKRGFNPHHAHQNNYHYKRIRMAYHQPRRF